jgi:6-phosphogluconolactonase
VGTTPFLPNRLGARGDEAGAPLMAYVGTFSAPLRDVLPTQVDLPPGNGRGIHLFRIDRATGAMAPAGLHELGTSPSCLAVNTAGTRLYSANETDRVGEDKHGTVSAFAIDRAHEQLTLLNTVPSGGAGPTYVSIHPSGRFLLVANYFGGSVAVVPILADGRLGAATDVKIDAGQLGPARATSAPPGSFAFSGHDRTHAHMIHADPSGRFVLHVDLGHDLRLEVRRAARRPDGERAGCRVAAARRRSEALPFPSGWAVALFDPGGGLDDRSVRLRHGDGPAGGAADDLHAAARLRRE